MDLFVQLLNKLDYRLSSTAFSRPQFQTKIIVEKIRNFGKNIKISRLLDIGGGQESQYKSILSSITKEYLNLEIKKGPYVDIVGSVYKIPSPDSSVNVITLFMVLEHLKKPLEALKECRRVLAAGGYLAVTTVQYWHTHNHPNDYFRYTKEGLKYLCKEAGFKVVEVWSMGGPFLVIFHAIELNLPGVWRTIFSILFYRIFDWLDWFTFKHDDKREHPDSVGWSLIAKKT